MSRAAETKQAQRTKAFKQAHSVDLVWVNVAYCDEKSATPLVESFLVSKNGTVRELLRLALSAFNIQTIGKATLWKPMECGSPRRPIVADVAVAEAGLDEEGWVELSVARV